VVIKARTAILDEPVHTGPKVLGKIDLSPKPKPAPAPRPEVKPEPAKHVQPRQSKPEPKQEQKPQPRPQQPVQPVAPRPQQPVSVKPAPKPVEPVVVQTKTYDERMAESTTNVFRPDDDNRLEGPKVLGKIDVSTLPGDSSRGGRREKRKRITKDKVDVTKPQPGGQGGQGKPGQKGGGPARNEGKGKKKGSPKPVVRPEVNDEEVQKQVKETLARLTAKGGKGKGAKYRKDKRDAFSARMSEEMERSEMASSTLQVTEFVTVSELATMMNVPVTEVIMA
jgi:translation initiation factor IF-2